MVVADYFNIDNNNFNNRKNNLKKKENSNYHIIADFHEIARLGEGLNQTKFINKDALTRATLILTKYKQYIKDLQIEKVRAVATSAMRDALNGSDIASILSDILGINIEIISGNEEANLSFLGSVEIDSEAALINIGGGSTEIICGENGHIKQSESMNIGVVRLSERFFDGKHPYLRKNFDDVISEIHSHLCCS